jgi:phosphotransferase system HPr (HPr) family protein
MTEQQAILRIEHPAGLHLRPAALFVRTANRFQSEIHIQNLSRPSSIEVNAKSMLALMQAAVSQGHQVRVHAEGVDAAEAVAALADLVEANFSVPG